MFETVAPARFEKPSRKPLYEALPLSIAVHAAAGAVLLVTSVWTVAFPLQSPAQAVPFAVAAPPPPPPPPPPPAAPESLPKQPAAVPKIAEIVAPAIIPDLVPVVPPAPVVSEAVPEPVINAVADGVPGGVAGGVAGGDLGGEIGGQIGGMAGNELPARLVVPRDKPLPMFALSYTYPEYPENARARSWEDEMVVRYVIGTNGRVKEVSVIRPPQRDAFVLGTLRAIRSWRFRPLVKDGQRQEVVHELTIFYRLTG